MTNHEVAQRFQQIADTLEVQGENPFKVRAYRNAVEAIERLVEPLDEIERRGELEEIPGFGEAITAKTRDFLTKGTTKLYEQIKNAVPPGVLKLAAVPGIGPKTARALWESAGVKSVEEAEAAAKEGRIQTAPGFGAAKEKKLLEAINRGRRLSERLPLWTALPYVERLAAELAARPEVVRAEAAGSARRHRDTVGDLDIVVATNDPAATEKAVAGLSGVTEVMESGRAKVAAMTDIGMHLDVRLGRPEDFGALLHHFSSGQAHNIALRELAESMGLKINEYGVFDAKTGAERFQGEDEAQVYTALGLPYIEPELREGRGEIEAARRNALPRLVTEADFRGQLHEHTTWSDGTASVRQMAEAAIARGYEYLAITDHSHSLQIANGLSRERLLEQLDEVAAVRRELPAGFTLLTGIEADILADGSLDCEEDLLARLDIVVGSVHIRHKEDEAAMTARVVRALESPYLHILGHPTGRLLGKREPFPLDMEVVIAAAVRTGTVLEINASPDRMDLNDLYAHRAKQQGARLTVNADAHSTTGLGSLRWGLYMARRAWLTPEDVVNTYPLQELRRVLKPRTA
ncbi:MAG TPA: DNA polymerase/3'-5' exonuclease PolX [Chthonomonadaceae bacterium]|nr:DNA polymerase/3'-5' exonuclease PolX [Chthonomonadaceae bacterium]